jgi:hypothetical protein
VVAGDEGARFTVVVRSDFGSITSSPPAVLRLLGAPVITSQPQNLTITNGDTAVFSVTASPAGALSYQWRFNGGNLPQQTNATLVLSNAGPTQAGNYDCGGQQRQRFCHEHDRGPGHRAI